MNDLMGKEKKFFEGERGEERIVRTDRVDCPCSDGSPRGPCHLRTAERISFDKFWATTMMDKERNKVATGTRTALVKIDPKYFRPTEVELLIGDPSKAKERLGWTPKTTMQQLCKEMVEADIKLVQKGDFTS